MPATAFSLSSAVAAPVDALTTDAAGNVYVSGDFGGTVDFDPGPGTVTLTSGGTASADGYLAKYAPDGSLVWVGQYVDGVAQALSVSPDGNLYVTGRFNGTVDFDFGAGTSTLPGGSQVASFAAKYDPNGGLVWARQFGGQTSGLSGLAIAADAAGNVYAAGTTSNGTADLDPGAGTFTVTNTSGNGNSYFVKLDSSGAFVWGGQFANDPSIAATVVIKGLGVDAAGNVYAAGLFGGRADFDPGAGTSWLAQYDPGQGGGDGFVAKLDAAGQLSYLVHVGSPNGRDDCDAIVVDAAGNAYVDGLFNGNLTIDATANDGNLTSAGSFDAYVMRLDPAGGLDWARRYGSTSLDSAFGIAADGAGNLYLTGYFAETVDFDPNAGVHNLTYGGGGYDTYGLKLRTDSTFVDAWGLGGTGTETPVGIGPVPGGGAAVGGRFQGTGDFDPGPGTLTLTSVSNADGFVAIVDPAPNDPPVATDGTLTTDEDTTAPGTLAATDPNGNPFTFALVDTSNAHGTVTVTNVTTGAYSYTPDSNYHGPASFTFKANDGTVDSNVATVSITVNSVNDPPVAAAGTGSTPEDVALNGTVGATDADGDPLAYSVVAGPSHGTLTAFNAATGAFTYTPAANYNGGDSFTFKANDGTADSNTGTFSITVAPVNDPPTAADDAADLIVNSPATAVDVLANDSDAPDAGETLTIVAVTQPAHGSVAVTGGGTRLTYAPAAGYSGPDSFTYTISDGTGLTATATVTVKVSEVLGNYPPVAIVDAAEMVEDSGPLGIDVLANDSTLPDSGEVLTVESVTRPGHGTAAVAADGLSVTYTPAADFAGTDTFYYTVTDGRGGRAFAPVVVTVTNDAADRLEVVPTAGVVEFTEGDPATVVDAGLRVGTAAGGLVTGATVRVTAGYVPRKDVLVFTPDPSRPTIKGRFDPRTGTLKLTGAATPAAYEAALRTVRYQNASQDPVDGTRVVTFQLKDAAGVGDPAGRAVRVTGVDDAPMATLPNTVVAARVGRSAAVLGGLKLVDFDSAFLEGATVTIANVQPADTLAAVTTRTGITAAYANGVLTLSGRASVATYLKVLKSVRFLTAGGIGETRTLSLTVTDGQLASDPVTRLVSVGS